VDIKEVLAVLWLIVILPNVHSRAGLDGQVEEYSCSSSLIFALDEECMVNATTLPL
jgi:hypothetical protein